MTTNAPQQGHEGGEVLSARELDVLSLLVRGKTNAEMAAALDVSERTVYSHIESIKHKLDLSSRADLLRYVRENGLK
jgi:DNA-binding CsgD family transcriptional regulator